MFMKKITMTSGGKCPYLSPAANLVLMETDESLLQGSVFLPDLTEEDMSWGIPVFHDEANINSL